MNVFKIPNNQPSQTNTLFTKFQLMLLIVVDVNGRIPVT